MTYPFPKDWSAYGSIAMVFFRLMGLMIIAPGFSHQAVPRLYKILFGLSLSVALFPLLESKLMPVPSSIEGIVAYAISETAIGFVMGFAAYITFEAINLAAQFVGYQLGFGSVGVLDPASHASVSALVPLAGWIGLMLMLLTDMHHQILHLFVASFDVTRAKAPTWAGNSALTTFVVDQAGRLFIEAVRLAAPFTLLVLACNCVVGILSRMLPQMQMLLFVFPITMTLGLAALWLVMPEWLDCIGELVQGMAGNLAESLRML